MQKGGCESTTHHAIQVAGSERARIASVALLVTRRYRKRENCLVVRTRAVCADRFVWHVALAVLDPVVDRYLAHRAKSFVIESGDTERGTQLFIELSKVLEVGRERRNLYSFVSQQKFLISSIP